jgi:hypothetical protein
MNNNIISRQNVVNLTIGKNNIIYADISNNKKRFNINMEEVKSSIQKGNFQIKEIKQYKVNNNKTFINKSNEKFPDMTFEQKKDIQNKIKFLNKQEYFFIFKLISQDTNKYTENINGIFINLNNLCNKTLWEIHNYIYTLIQNKTKLNNKRNSSNIDDKIIESDNENINENENESDDDYNIDAFQEDLNPIKLSNYEKSIIKKNKYIIEQQEFKNLNSWSHYNIKKSDSSDNIDNVSIH